jgi:hypothetical protein
VKKEREVTYVIHHQSIIYGCFDVTAAHILFTSLSYNFAKLDHLVQDFKKLNTQDK